MVKGQIEKRISKLKHNFKQPTGKVLQNADVKACLSDLHSKYVSVPADKAPNNVIIICKQYFIETLIKELGLDNCSTPTGNSTYTSCQMSSEDIVNTHDTFMKSLSIELSDDDNKLPYLYWTPKLHKSPVRHRFIAGYSKCTTKGDILIQDPRSQDSRSKIPKSRFRNQATSQKLPSCYSKNTQDLNHAKIHSKRSKPC